MQVLGLAELMWPLCMISAGCRLESGTVMQATCVVRTTNLPARIQDGALVTLVLRLLATWTGSCAVEVKWEVVLLVVATSVQNAESHCFYSLSAVSALV
jgi:hypothetical protein